MRYFLRFAYDGTNYHGSQSQPNGITVQETLEKALSTILRCPTALTFSGRTDAGVHARQMYAHWDSEVVAPDDLVLRLNSLLPDDIAVYDNILVPDDAHARFDAVARTYHYCVTDHKDPFLTHFCTRVPSGLDYEAMNSAAQLLLGEHDFASFCRVHTDVKTTLCTIFEAHWKINVDGTATFTITANRFLRNMVRAVVGTLFEVGKGHMSREDFQCVIDARNRCSAGQSADAQGLYLVNISYPASIIPPIASNFSQQSK